MKQGLTRRTVAASAALVPVIGAAFAVVVLAGRREYIRATRHRPRDGGARVHHHGRRAFPRAVGGRADRRAQAEQRAGAARHGDGPQRLVSLALELRGAEAIVRPEQDELRAQLVDAATGLAAATADLQRSRVASIRRSSRREALGLRSRRSPDAPPSPWTSTCAPTAGCRSLPRLLCTTSFPRRSRTLRSTRARPRWTSTSPLATRSSSCRFAMTES